MSKERVTVRVHPGGKTEIKVEGVGGPACLQRTAKLVESLGGRVHSTEYTEEFHAQQQQEAYQNVGG